MEYEGNRIQNNNFVRIASDLEPTKQAKHIMFAGVQAFFFNSKQNVD